jgi:transposase
MRYLGLDVHSKESHWCLLDPTGEILGQGKVDTTVPALHALRTRSSGSEELWVGQEVGTMAYFVHDTMTAAGVRVLSFNPYHLRMIAASRKKTDRRDAYWIARAMQTGMTPPPVYIPTGEIRDLRELLARRRIVQRDRNRWHYRAHAYLRATGHKAQRGAGHLRKAMDTMLESPDGVQTTALDRLGLCDRQMTALREELGHIEAKLKTRVAGHDAIRRLQTIPSVGIWTATTIYAWVGDVSRFPNAKRLGSYAGLVPRVRQTGETERLGGITKEGSGALRATLVQAAHVISRCRGEDAKPLQAIAERVRGSRGRKKIANVALARHILRIAYYILRDGTEYDASRLSREVADATG